jgi:leucyl/phenylalanyl-tRNA--protein transferase
VAVGGPLTVVRLLEAYRAGLFPWYNEGLPVMWWSPDPRCVIELDGLHISRRLARTIRQGRFTLTVNTAFEAVMAGCAERAEGSWITAEMLRAYAEMHRLGHAHSVEAWRGEELVGGVYGVAVGGMFAGESMFHRTRDASKVALAFLVDRLRERGFVLFDIQVCTEHTRSMGAVDVPRAEYLRRLKAALEVRARFA